MADEDKDKSEKASSYKLRKAREKGTVARGTDLGLVTSLAAAAGFLWISGDALGGAMSEAISRSLVGGPLLASGAGALLGTIPAIFARSVHLLSLMLGAMFLLVLLFELIQTGVVVSSEPLKPDFARLNPARGLKRVFSLRQLFETGKNIFKLAVYTTVSWLSIRGAFETAAVAGGNGVMLGAMLAKAGFRLIAALLGVALIFAVLDQIIVRWDFAKRMRMSRRDVRREHRDREGDPRLKQKRKALHAEFVKVSQSMRGLRGADVLITNPQHIALALRYDAKVMSAPVVVSMGTNRVAERLKRLAFLYGVTVIENRPLARELLRHAALNRTIPDHCFQPVADIYNRMNRERSAASPEAISPTSLESTA
jgi:flagellar biosynthetic protein FlhB